MKAARSKSCKILKKKNSPHIVVFQYFVRHCEQSGNHRSVRGVRTLANFVRWLALKYILLLLTHFRKTGTIAIVTTSLTRSSHKNRSFRWVCRYWVLSFLYNLFQNHEVRNFIISQICESCLFSLFSVLPRPFLFLHRKWKFKAKNHCVISCYIHVSQR